MKNVLDKSSAYLSAGINLVDKVELTNRSSLFQELCEKINFYFYNHNAIKNVKNCAIIIIIMIACT